ncbi:probable sulfate transporter 3.4 [Chenopodium quinoa]|uniref:probable sulfate transporter 3.4 n=1 Tax=Chenopodium quinoa TaxID=63459 RepID=UPI000B770556|nr:probable sulfate transporter 3.4 [Chenopodium quinoa]
MNSSMGLEDQGHQAMSVEQEEMSINVPNSLRIHSVSLPPKKTTLQKLKHKLNEIFFPDDPLYQFKNKNLKTKLILGFQYIFPILQWLPTYGFQLFRSDLVAGLTIASLAIPQGISYAKLANLPPIIGLYSSFVPPLIYSVLGSSKHLGVGPVSIASLVMGAMLTEFVSPVNDSVLYLKLAFTSTLFAGLFQAWLGFFRLGFIIDFLSKATLIGFMAGAAVIVSLQQLKGLLGINHFTSKMQIIPVLSSVFSHRNEWSWQTIVMGISFLFFLLAARQISTKKPRLFWISAAAPLASVILSTFIVFCLKSNADKIPKIGQLPKGLNPPSVNMLYFHSSHIALAAKTGLITGILSLTEGIAVGRTFASLENYQVDGNKEMMAIGIMNVVGSCSSCYVTTGAFSRSAVNYNAGAKTAFSNIVMATAVLVTLLFLMPLFYYTPNVVLAAIIITAVIGLIDYQGAYRLWKVDKLDFVACLSSFFGVLFISVPSGLSLAVGISVFKVLLHITRPNIVSLGNIPGTQMFQSLERYKNASRIPSFLVLGVEAPIYFANSTYLQERILRSIREEEDWIKSNRESMLNYVILDMTAVTAIDTSGIDTIQELGKIIRKRSLQLTLVNPVGSVMEKLHKSKVLELFGSNNGVYMSVGEAILDLTASRKVEGLA